MGTSKLFLFIIVLLFFMPQTHAAVNKRRLSLLISATSYIGSILSVSKAIHSYVDESNSLIEAEIKAGNDLVEDIATIITDVRGTPKERQIINEIFTFQKIGFLCQRYPKAILWTSLAAGLILIGTVFTTIGFTLCKKEKDKNNVSKI